MSLSKSRTFTQPGQSIGLAAARLPDRLNRFSRVRLAFAWASGEVAISKILSSWEVSGSWGGANKQALIGINRGITSSSALAKLMEAGFEVRVPSLSETLNSNSLSSKQLFHSKAICFDCGGGPFALLIGSANLTDQGMGANKKENAELASVFVGEPEDINHNLNPFNEWWDRIWEESEELTQDKLDEYQSLVASLRALRPKPRGRIRKIIEAIFGTDDVEFADDVPFKSNSEYSRMWIINRKMSGGAGTQLDVPNSITRKFFGVEPNTEFSEMVKFNYGNISKTNKIDFRRGEGLNKQLRLNLISASKGGPETYEGKILILSIISREPWVIKIDLKEPGSKNHRNLIKYSKLHGELGQTKPGKSDSRQWGLF